MAEFWDYLINNWAVFTLIALIFVALVVIAVSYAISNKRDARYAETVEDQRTSVRIFVIDVPNDNVKFFNVTDLRHVRSMSLGDFYRQFPLDEQTKVIKWINAIADPKMETPTYLETDVLIHGAKKQYFSMLQVDHVDYKTGKIHLQSYLLKYMKTEKGASGGHGLTSEKDLCAAISSAPKNRGMSFCFRFAYQKMSEKDKEIDPLVFNQLKNVFFPFLNPKRYLMEASRNEVIFTDLRLNEHAQGLYTAHAVLNDVARYLSLNGLSGKIGIWVGVVEHNNFPGDGDTIVQQARKTAEIAQEDNDLISWYEKGKQSETLLNDVSYRTEVERIINDKKLNYFFRPIFSVDKLKTIGYLAKATPVDTYFDSIEELKDYAMRTQDDKNLFATIAKNIVPLFVNEKQAPNEVLFFPARMDERGYMLTTFSRLGKVKDAHIVFMFAETDVKSHIDINDPDVLLSDMRLIKAKGYEVALLLNESDLLLPPNLYNAFDYFVVSFAFAGSATGMDTRIRSELHALVEKLLKYNKPIIASDIDGWNAIELLVRSGLNYISSESFAPYNQMIVPLPPKNVRKVQDMKGYKS
jgi:hypothetical protein